MKKLIGIAALLLLLGACEKKSAASSGDAEPDSWLVFEVYEAGTGNGLAATVWPKDQPDAFETVVEGEAGSAIQFAGIGRQEEGYALPISPGEWVILMIWSPGHELKRVNMKVKKGENVVSVELKTTEVEDDQVPETIRLNVLEALPSQGPKSGG